MIGFVVTDSNGKTLKKGIDYTIDTNTMTITNAPNVKIGNISYAWEIEPQIEKPYIPQIPINNRKHRRDVKYGRIGRL